MPESAKPQSSPRPGPVVVNLPPPVTRANEAERPAAARADTVPVKAEVKDLVVLLRHVSGREERHDRVPRVRP
jgi:hypothetical protein